MSDRFDDDALRRAYAATANDSSVTHRADCPSGEALLAALRGEGGEAERLQVLDGALRCAACRRDLALLRAVSEGSAPTQLGARVFSWRRLAPLAAAASIVFVVGVIGVDQWRQRQDTMRAGNEGQPALIEPAGSSVPAAAPVTFVWHPVPRSLRYTLEVYAADGTVLFSSATADTTMTARFDNVARGEQRWTVRAHLDDGSERRSETRVLRLR